MLVKQNGSAHSLFLMMRPFFKRLHKIFNFISGS